VIILLFFQKQVSDWIVKDHRSDRFLYLNLGLNYGWRTQTLRSSISINEPFFFDSSGSFYFNTTPPLLIIQATEQSLVATSHVNINILICL
jgi:hypothetical protein